MENKNKMRCSICGKEFVGFGNNAWPINEGRCCDTCNDTIVIPRRIVDLYYLRKEKEKGE